ncbi:MAG: universal stress protein [Chromatiales bacterium]|nr:universal stress protein [Chromatiales bacterium]
MSANDKSTRTPCILVPVDFSERAARAVRMAAYLAECMRHRLTILHVVHDPGEMPGYYARVMKKKRLTRIDDVAQEMLTDFVGKLKKRGWANEPVKQAQTLLRVGLPVQQILSVVEDEKPTMVVIGSQGRTGLSHLMLGSKAEQCVRLCPVPVLVVKANNRPPTRAK